MGQYILDKEKDTFFKELSFGPMTYAGETSDGKIYLEALRTVNRFNINSRGLSLYYDSDNYLLFKPLKE